MLKLENMKRYGFLIAIAIVLVIFVNVGIYTFYKSPKYEDFCRAEFIEKPYPIVRDTEICRQIEYSEFRDKTSVYNRNVFIILSIAGVISIVISLLLNNFAVVNGLMFGGIINIIVGIVRYWSDMDEYLRFIISGVILIILIYVAYKKLR